MPNKFFNSLKDKAGSFIDRIDDKLDDVGDNFEFDFVGIKKAGEDTFRHAASTNGLCEITITKAKELVAYGQELSSALHDVSGGDGDDDTSRGMSLNMNPLKMATIMDLLDGDKIKSSMKLSRELSESSQEMISSSQAMIASMESGIDALPDAIESHVENKMNKAQSKGAKPGDPKIPDIDENISALKQLTGDIQDVNLLTVVPSSKDAFEGLRKNGEMSKDMFGIIQGFARDVEKISETFCNFDKEQFKKPRALFLKCKDIGKDSWRCLRLSGLMKLFAEKVKLLIQEIIELLNALKAVKAKCTNGLSGLASSMKSDGVKEGITNFAGSFIKDLDADDMKGLGEGMKKLGNFFK